MNASIQQSIASLATRFADEILRVITEGLAQTLSAGDASLPVALGRRTRARRRTEADLSGASDRIVATLEKNSGELRAEDLRAKAGMTRAAMGRPLKMLLASGRVRKTGQKRSTVYRLAGTAATAPAAKAPPSSNAAKKALPEKAKAKPNGKAAAKAATAKVAPAKKAPKRRAASPTKTNTAAKARVAKKPAAKKPAKKPAAKKPVKMAAKKGAAKAGDAANPAASGPAAEAAE
jgi:hypothetical protein